ncbi:MAG TPA: tRNA (adenosine(37)-N6)-threonylcarbamoyltransferase complex dimerization subunit type 1 TsaB [Gammaproteobacteria bacterium]
MKLLALDTATEACSAALYIDGEIHQQYQLAPREHTQLILQMAEHVLAQAGIAITDLDALAFGCGPGSFTGVRIATGVVQGMAFGADLPVVPVSTLASMAQLVLERESEKKVLSIIDARMGEIYFGAYAQAENGLMQLQGEEALLKADQIPLPESSGWSGAGTGWAAYGQSMQQLLGNKLKSFNADVYPQSKTIARLAVAAFERGEVVPAEQAIPVYLRDNVAKKAQS